METFNLSLIKFNFKIIYENYIRILIAIIYFANINNFINC